MTTQAPVYGLIEWDGSYRPTVVAGCCYAAVVRNVVAIFTALGACGRPVGSKRFQQDYPLPRLDGQVEDLAEWLDLLREDTTVPYVTLMDSTEFVNSVQLEKPDPRVATAGVIPQVVNGYPVMAAVAEGEHAGSWIVICRRTEPMPDWAETTNWYVTWRVWWAQGRWQAETGDYGPHHGLTWPQAQQSLLRRLDLAGSPTAPVNPDIYLSSSDDGDALTCPACHQPITWLQGDDKLGSLLAEATAHQCNTAEAVTAPDNC
jgi:hypothetical protein